MTAARLTLYSLVLLLMIAGLGSWFAQGPAGRHELRVPIPENDPSVAAEKVARDANQGTLIPGTGVPSEDRSQWPCFRGPARDGIAAGTPIASLWPADGPRELWRVPVGQGHAGAAVRNGCVYLCDYDEAKKEDAIRCLSLDDGQELWRYTYYVKVKQNHGMSRTVPAVTDAYLVSLGPKCHVVCLRAKSGEPVWKKDLVREYGSKVPEWYAGQCPLIEGDRVILAPGGSCLMMAVDLATGTVVWETPNEQEWDMTHSSILPVEFGGRRMYVWCASGGVVGVEAETGRLLWTLPDWYIKIANVPTPVDLTDGRILLTGGYNAGGMMIRLTEEDGRIQPKVLFRTKPEVFGSDQQTPIFMGGVIYGVIPGGKLACLSPEGEQLWVREDQNFWLGPYLAADGKLLVLDDEPVTLHLMEVGPSGARTLATHAVTDGHDAWAPMAFAGGKLILRDSVTLVCLDLR